MPKINEMPSEVIYRKVLNREDVLSNGNFPASSYYIDISELYLDKFEFYIIHGAIENELTWAVQQADAVDGSLSAVTGASKVVADTGSDTEVCIEVKVANLDDDEKPFVCLTLSGAGVVSESEDYATVIFMGYSKHVPVTQPTSFSAVTVAG